MKRYILDARDMQHPEPLERAISILRVLDENSYLYMIHRMQPVPLIALANEHNLNHLSITDSGGIWHILITPNSSIDLNTLIADIDSLMKEECSVSQ